MTPATRPARIGSAVRGFRLLRQLDAGPTGEVYVARDEALHHDVALKLFDPLRCAPGGVARFAAAARAAATIPATGAPRVLATITDPPEPYVALELLTSPTLAQLLRRHGSLPWAVVRPLFARAAACLHAAHAAGLVHGRLKPTNLHVEVDRVRLVDFGADTLNVPVDTGHTRVHDTQSVDYRAPEHLRGEPSGAPADLYALGVLLFEAVTGQRPFVGRPQEVVRHHLNTQPPSALLLAPALPPDVDAVLLALLAKSPTLRPTADELMRRLASPDDADADPPEEHQTTMWVRPDRALVESTPISETVVLPNPPPPPPGEVTLMTPGMHGDFLLDANVRTDEPTGVQPSATVFVDRAALAAHQQARTQPTAPRPRWRRLLASPWPLERKLIALNLGFGACLLLALLYLLLAD